LLRGIECIPFRTMPPTAPRLHVAHLTFYADPGRRPPEQLISAWRDFGVIAAAASRSGVSVTVLQCSWVEADHLVDGVACHFVRPDRVWARLADCAPDLIHVHGLLYPGKIRALTARFRRVPILVQDHGSAVPRRQWRRWWHRWGFARLTAVMFTARGQAAAFQHAGVLRPTVRIFEAIEVSTPFAPGDRAAARAATGLHGDPCLLWVGNLDPNKDPLTVLAAVSRAARELPGLRLWMGYRFAPLLSDVRETIARDPLLIDRVGLLGEVAYPGIEQHFRAADFLVQASHKEGSGYGVIEALACGTTPLVTDIPSFRVITAEGAVGALVPPGDSAALARAIVDWAGRDRAEQRRRARAHFERALSFDAIGHQLVTAYRQLAGR